MKLFSFFQVVVLLYRIITLEINFRNQSIEEYSSNTNTSRSIVFSLTQASWFCSVVFDSFRYPKHSEKEIAHYSERLEFESVIYLSEFFIGKYNDLNIVWFWRFITSLQTYHTMKTKLVEQSPKFKVLNAIQYMKSTADIFSCFHLSQNWTKFKRYEFSQKN